MSNYIVQDIFFSCTEVTQHSGEHFVPEHGLAHIFSGEMRVADADQTYALVPGQTVLFSRNRLARFIKHPGADGTFRMITLFFRQSFLRQYYATHPVRPGTRRTQDAILLTTSPLLHGLFQSLLPYEGLTDPLPDELVALKLAEALTIVRPMDPGADGLLSDFSEPGKIDLAEFMHKNYSFNISLEHFAYLTGRSLATFKRDFRKIFPTSPQKWLLERRLRQAHFLIAEKKVRPSEACMEVGFENLSHFSAAFKQQFGYTASSLR
jgi:AraC-like DNA-binding protein